MKLILTSDLHQRIEKWPKLVAAVQAEEPRFVLIAGDLLPKTTFADQKAFFKELRRLFQEMKRSGPLTALTYLGNDDAQGNYVRLANLVEYLTTKPSIANELDQLKKQLRAGEMERSIWMVHQPPSGLGMDICADGRQVGSPTVLSFIQQNQPLLGCSGHIHESPYQPGGRWLARAGKTVWVQPGQVERQLHYVGLEITGRISVTKITHSLFGSDNP
jgi:Icc-related predicted phosphoesterase